MAKRRSARTITNVLSEIGERQGHAARRPLAGAESRTSTPHTAVRWCVQRHTGEQVLHALGRREVPIHERTAFNEYDADKVIRAYLPLVAKEQPDFSMDKRQLFADRKHFSASSKKIIAAWTANRPHDVRGPGVLGRILRALRAKACAKSPTPGRVVVFTSGGVITAALRQALKLDDETSFRMNWRILTTRYGRRGSACTQAL